LSGGDVTPSVIKRQLPMNYLAVLDIFLDGSAAWKRISAWKSWAGVGIEPTTRELQSAIECGLA
jgi:hypothetical protein